MAAACVFVMQLSDEQYEGACGGEKVSHLNVGSGEDRTIREMAEIIYGVVGYEGEVSWDGSKPDGMPQKLLDVSRLSALGWSPRIGLAKGVRHVYDWYRSGGSG
jgi:nucleoside-diphosphate-sugar epimerase